MNIHNNARLTPKGRELLVQRMVIHGLRPQQAAQAAGVSSPTAYKWLRRYREEGLSGLQDRSSRPRICPHATSQAQEQCIIELRRQRRTYRQIAQVVGVSMSTIARLLARRGLNRLAALAPVQPANRYVHKQPGDMLHLDVKKLGRFNRPGHRVTGDHQQGRSRGAG